MAAKTDINGSTADDGCEDCGGRLILDEHRGELECVDCGLTAPAPQAPMNHVPEGHGTTRTGNPYHKEATGSNIGTSSVDLRDVPAKERAKFRRMAKHNKFSKPNQAQHHAAKVWDLVAEENGNVLADALYDSSLLDDLLRPVRPDAKGNTLTQRAKAILAAAEKASIHLVQPSGSWCRSTSKGKTKAQRDANKLTSEQKVAILAAASVAVYGKYYPGAPTNIAATQTRLLARSGLDMQVAKDHLKYAIKALFAHLQVLSSLDFFTPRTRDAATHEQWVDDQVGHHMEDVARVLGQDASLEPYLDNILRDAAQRLDAMKAVDKAMGTNSPYLLLPPVKRAGLAVYCALRALGLERGRRALLAEALILCLDTLPLLRERLLNTCKHGLEPVA